MCFPRRNQTSEQLTRVIFMESLRLFFCFTASCTNVFLIAHNTFQTLKNTRLRSCNAFLLIFQFAFELIAFSVSYSLFCVFLLILITSFFCIFIYTKHRVDDNVRNLLHYDDKLFES